MHVLRASAGLTCGSALFASTARWDGPAAVSGEVAGRLARSLAAPARAAGSRPAADSSPAADERGCHRRSRGRTDIRDDLKARAARQVGQAGAIDEVELPASFGQGALLGEADKGQASKAGMVGSTRISVSPKAVDHLRLSDHSKDAIVTPMMRSSHRWARKA